MTYKKPELLIPASSLEVLKTAVIFGTDAVYIGDTVTDSHAAKDAQVPFALATWTNQPSDDLQPIAYALKTPADLLTL